jgi:dolichyl-diphosphooligosaccharide--protein glycosyltransferase
MGDVRSAVEDLLDDKPDVGEDLRAVLKTDRSSSTWTFDDIPLDSGVFGELVSRGIVEKVGGEYRLADLEAVERALDGEPPDDPTTDSTESRTIPESYTLSIPSFPSVSRRAGFAVLASLAVLVVLRIAFVYSSVFRDGNIVMLGNDPWFYRYWAERLVESDLSAFSVGDLGRLPNGVKDHDVLAIVTMWWATSLFGGTNAAAGTVLAWYPLLAGVGTGLVVYLLTVHTSGDRRAGIAAIFFLAVTPIHALRTALGFGDHHAFDYLWLGFLALGVVVLAVRRDDGITVDRWKVPGIACVGVGIGALVAAWRGGPLLVAPIAVYAVLVSLTEVRAGNSLQRHGPLLAGIGLGAVLALGLHVGFGWMQFFRAVTPSLLFVGAGLVFAAGELAVRYDRSPVETGIVQVGIGVGSFLVAGLLFPSVFGASGQLFAYFGRTSQARIVETYSLVNPRFGSVLGPMFYFGFVLFLAVPLLVVLTWIGYRDRRPGWLVLGSFGLFFLPLSFFQIRFAGQISLFTAVYAGVGFVWLADRIGIIEAPSPFDDAEAADRTLRPAADMSNRTRIGLPSASNFGYLVVLFVLIANVGLIGLPGFTGLPVDDSVYQAATWTSDYANQQDDGSPNYVFSDWDVNRMYNYIVTGNSRSYAYARDNYGQFLSSSQPERWYDRLRGRAGFVVTSNADEAFPESSIQVLLHENLGSHQDGQSGVANYRAMYVGRDGSPKVFELVPGARITGVGPPNTTIDVSTTVELRRTTFTYARQVRTNRYGDYGVTVPYPGSFEVGGRTVAVDESTVASGGYTGTYLAHFPFDEGSGSTVTDPVGGISGTVTGGTWATGPTDGAIRFDGQDDTVSVEPNSIDLTGTKSFTVCARADPGESTAVSQDVVHLGDFQVILGWNGQREEWSSFFRNKTGPNTVTASPVNATGGWTFACGRYDGEALSLWLDGKRVASRPASGTITNSSGQDSFGSSDGRDRFFEGTIADVRVYRRALSPETIRTLASSNRTSPRETERTTR